MAEQREDYVAIRLDEKLGGVLKNKPSEACIFKVPHELRMIKKEAYEPNIISIGPYHRHNVSLKPMEDYKLRCLQTLLERRKEDSAARYIKAMRDLEDRARRSYAEPVSLSKDEFVEMMVLDGCFVFEVIRKTLWNNPGCASDDPMFQLRNDIPRLKRDMFLLENQLPFFVLWKLFEMITRQEDGENFFQLIFDFFSTILPGEVHGLDNNALSAENIGHLLGFVHDNWLPSGLEYGKEIEDHATEEKPIGTATRLEEAGIKLMPRKQNWEPSKIICNVSPLKLIKWTVKRMRMEMIALTSSYSSSEAERFNVFDIEFKKGRLLIPPLKIHALTETILRNLIAYEQVSKDLKNPDHVLDYTMFMDCLINSTKDVEILQEKEIIENWFGDEKPVADLFNRLGDQVVHLKASYYCKTLKEINRHCSNPWHKEMAKLRRGYFNSPWAFISFLAAVFLLLLSLAQTIYSILSYYKDDSQLLKVKFVH